MNPRDFLLERIRSLFGRVIKADLTHRSGVTVCPGESTNEFRWNSGSSSQLRHALEAPHTGDWSNPGRVTPLDKTIEIMVTEKKLRADVVRSRINLGQSDDLFTGQTSNSTSYAGSMLKLS